MSKTASLVVLLLFFALVFSYGLIIYHLVSSDKVTIFKNEWECTDQRTVKRNQLVGKILVPVKREICSQYTLK